MPGKPSRKDRRRSGPNGTTPQRRPRPAPAVRAARPVVPADNAPINEAQGDLIQANAGEAPAVADQPGSQPSQPARRPGGGPPPRATGTTSDADTAGREPAASPSRTAVRPGARRPGGTSSARALEQQREQSVQLDTFHDLKVTGIVAGIAILGLILAVVIS
jgi:hypothetical protein